MHGRVPSLISYEDLINEYKKAIKSAGPVSASEERIFNDWHTSRRRRNALAHVTEEYDDTQKCYCIISKTDRTIRLLGKETDIITQRLALNSLKLKIFNLIKDHPL